MRIKDFPTFLLDLHLLFTYQEINSSNRNKYMVNITHYEKIHYNFSTLFCTMCNN